MGNFSSPSFLLSCETGIVVLLPVRTGIRRSGPILRLDKFLKVSRLIKRRTLAKEVCDQGRISIKDKPLKASSTLSVGDELVIRFGQKKVTVRVDRLTEHAKKEDAAEMYTIVHEEKLSPSSEV